MRLTLRTLLAYLDDLLDRRDAEELHTKIQSSPMASELVHRIRNTVGQIRLHAPNVEGQGMGEDANSVAEYLDNTLPPEQVPEFERVCLDSDVHLGEVASCHQVLTLVLGEPADVSPNMRRRVYSLGTESDADVLEEHDHNASLGSTQLPVTSTDVDHAPESETAPEPATSATSSPTSGTSDSDERWKYPDRKANYTTEKSFRVLPLALVALAAFILVFAGLRGLGPLDHTHPLAKMLGLGSQDQVAMSADSEEDAVPEVDLGDPLTPQPEQSTATFEDDQRFPDDRANSELADNDSLPTDMPIEVSPIDSAVDQTSDLPPAGGNEDEIAIDNSNDGFENLPPSNNGVGDLDATLPDVNEIALTNPTNPVVPPEPTPLGNPIENRIRTNENGATSPVPAFPGNLPDNNAFDGVADTTSNLDESSDILPGGVENDENVGAVDQPFDPVFDGSPVDETPESAGKLLATNSVALRLNPNSGSWERLPNGTEFSTGDEFLSLPVFRSELSMNNGAKVTMAGATNVVLLPSKRNGVPRLEIKYGRLVLAPGNEESLEMDLLIGSRETQIIFDDAASSAAIEVQKEHLPGTDPVGSDPKTVVQVDTISGIVHWTEVGQDAIQLDAGQRLAFVDAQVATPGAVDAAPTWVSQPFKKPIHKCPT